jgi:hypothetical protein
MNSTLNDDQQTRTNVRPIAEPCAIVLFGASGDLARRKSKSKIINGFMVI